MAGIGVVAGAVSGNLEVLDFDGEDAWECWRPAALADLHEAGLECPALPLVVTPGGGRHLYYRLTSAPAGHSILASGFGEHGTKRIETRGEGNYAVAPPSPGCCHPSGQPYRLLRGDLRHIPVISADVHECLHTTARAIAPRHESASKPVAPRPRAADGSRPGDLYNARADWAGLLGRHGWRKVRTTGAETLWCRPGKRRGISASTNHEGNGYLYVFSSNAPPFEPDRGYTLFGALGLLDYGGDYQAAAEDLAQRGYHAPAPIVARYTRPRTRQERLARVLALSL